MQKHCFKLGKINSTANSPSSSPSPISHLHQYYDSEIDKRRHTNWIRFLTITSEFDSRVNLICSKQKVD
ncbi:hypothetical protein B4U79_16078 [Dinothrombium tinctorium]|uniref:Uncharacterized protein n=1 Tax=Dinothrombium tinctorium TaxID=1965070 RepID=A0A3S3SIM7_9ACAR|nr:hypothetical protein B4U79_16078 [Dinothrombium tinctorium]